MKNYLKLISINLILLFCLIIIPAVIFKLFKIGKSKFSTIQYIDSRAYYPTYKNKDFALKLLNDLKKLTTEYKSFVGWRRNNFSSKYTTIKGPYRTRKSTGEFIKNSTWFFGGSTMWGHGASDGQTIPSFYNQITSLPVYNFSETSWNSRQSLNQFFNLIGDQQKPSVVIFFDGVNDVFQQCRTEISSLPAHGYEVKIKDSLSFKKTIKI